MSRLRLSWCAALVLSASACASGDSDPNAGFTGFTTDPTTTTTTTDPTTGTDDESGTGGDSTGTSTTMGDGDGDDTTSTSGDGDGGTGGAECGNGVIEGDEACDTGDLGGATCEGLGFGGGGLMCASDCTIDTSNCISCGNGVVDDSEEECDGSDLGANANCMDVGLGMSSEALLCGDDCKYVYDNCSGCGDGTITPPEDCEPPPPGDDKPLLNDQTCETLGFDGGDLDCMGCAFDTSACHVCGDAVKNGIEECDAADFGTSSCTDFASTAGPNFTDGSLACGSDCLIDTSNCMYCGDAIISGAEVCDGGELSGNTCQSLGTGYTGGTLGCSSTCDAYDESACTTCGDDMIEGDEQCEGTNFNGATCESLGYPGGGTLSCDGCVIDTSNCADNFCGDGTLDVGETCDCGNQGSNCTAAQLGNETCDTQGFDGGTLACNSPTNCLLDTSGCYSCGDGQINPGEQCDSGDVGGESCLGLGYLGGGTLGCNNNDCTYDTSQCIDVAPQYCTTQAVAIPDSSQVTTQIVVSGDPTTIGDLNISLDVTHTFTGDLEFYLSHDGGSEVFLFGDRCGTDENINCVVDDEGSAIVCGGNPAISGNVTPDNPLSFFDGQGVNGTWSLRVVDDAGIDTGFVNEWCIIPTAQ